MARQMASSDKEMDGVEKAATLLIALGPEKSAQIFKHLKEEEIEQLTLEIANTSSVSPQTKEKVLNEFYEICLAQQYIAEGGIGYAKELLEKALSLAVAKNNSKFKNIEDMLNDVDKNEIILVATADRLGRGTDSYSEREQTMRDIEKFKKVIRNA